MNILIGYDDFGLEIRQELLKKNKTVKWLAKEIGCSSGHLSEMLRGTRDLVTRDTNWKDKIIDKLKEEVIL